MEGGEGGERGRGGGGGVKNGKEATLLVCKR